MNSYYGQNQKRQTDPMTPGLVFGRLTIVKDAGIIDGRRRSECICECGNTKIVANRHLRSVATMSCGCLQPDKRTRHGETRNRLTSVEYIAWRSIIDRCENVRSPAFVDYGGRGISIHKNWRKYFHEFLSYVGRKPSPNMQLGRIDNDRGYEPGNVRWETPQQNCRNRRSTRLITVNGVRLSLAEWGDRSGIPSRTIRQRINSGWSAEEATSRQVATRNRKAQCPRNN
jgi:hypothetical protein